MSDPFQKYGDFSQNVAPQHVPVQPVMATKTSGLSIASVAFGALGVVTFCIIFIAGPMALAAIVSGHMALGSIRRSGGRVSGTAPAIIGLVLGYGSLLISISMTALVLLLPKTAPEDSPRVTALRQAGFAVGSNKAGHALGNSIEAKRIAEAFATGMEAADKALFTETDAKIKLSGGQYVTWCELHEGRCAFVVHVPEYRRFNDEAEKALEKLAWAMAQKAALEKLKPGDELGVGLKGVIMYGSVTVGEVVEGESEAGVASRGFDSDALLPFFESDAERSK